MPKSSNTITTAEDMLKRILHLLEESQGRSTSGNGTPNECRIYTNKELMKLLGVESRYLKNLRDNGYLSYSRHGDKFWYTQNDVNTFLQRFKYEAFANMGGRIGYNHKNMKKGPFILIVISLIFSLAMLSCDHVGNHTRKRHQPDASFDKIYGYGIDISHHNAEPIWEDLEVDFIILKASEGTTYQDPTFSRRAKHAAQKDIPVGAYHFFSGSGNPAGEFNNFQKQIKDKIDIIPVIDIERKPKNVSKKDFQKRFLKFMSLTKKDYGVYPIIYSSEGFYYTYLKEPIERKITEDTEVLLWFGDVGKKYKNYSLPPHIHQAQIKNVKGIKGKVDYNELHCDINNLLLRPSDD